MEPLAPNSDLIKELLTNLSSSSFSITAASHALLYAHLAKLDPDPTWIEDVRKSLKGAQSLATDWVENVGPDVIANIPQYLVVYGHHFQDFVDHSKDFDKDEAIVRIKRLQELAGPVPDALAAIQKKIGDTSSSLVAQKTALSKAIAAATTAANADQKESDSFSQQISDLRQKISGETEDAQNAIWGITSTSASVQFTLLGFGVAIALEANPAFPLLAVAAAVVGITVSSVIDATKEQEIADQLGQIADLQVKLSHENQLVGAIKSLRGVLQSVLDAIDGISNDVGFKPIWDDINKSLASLLAAVTAPKGNLSDFKKDLETAAAAWKTIAEMADNTQQSGIGSLGATIEVGSTGN